MNSKDRTGLPSLAVGLVLLAVLGSFALFPALLSPYDPREMFRAWQGCSPAHLLGTNDMGYDILSELIHAAAATLWVGVAAATVSLAVGTFFGLLAGFGRGLCASAADLVINVFILIPLLPAAIVVAAFAGAGNGNLIFTIGLLGWCGTARALRAGAAGLRRADFVDSLAILGIPRSRILVRHILPNLSHLVVSRFIMSVAGCIMTEATLSFVGLGDPTSVTWGGMISLAYNRGGFLRGAANWFVAPGLCITASVLAFYFISHYFEIRADRVSGMAIQNQ